MFKNWIIHRAVLTCSLTLNNDFTLTFQEPPKTIPELKLKITESFEVVRHNTAMLRRVQGALVRRCELVVNQQGKHFEHKVSKKTIFCS